MQCVTVNADEFVELGPLFRPRYLRVIGGKFYGSHSQHGPFDILIVKIDGWQMIATGDCGMLVREA